MPVTFYLCMIIQDVASTIYHTIFRVSGFRKTHHPAAESEGCWVGSCINCAADLMLEIYCFPHTSCKTSTGTPDKNVTIVDLI